MHPRNFMKSGQSPLRKRGGDVANAVASRALGGYPRGATSPQRQPTASALKMRSAFNSRGGVVQAQSSEHRKEQPVSNGKQKESCVEEPSGLRRAFNTRGGVVRERDGFEVFYGMEKSDQKPEGAKRDGFDIFYGIGTEELSRLNRARETNGVAVQQNENGAGRFALEEGLAQMNQLEQQLQVRLGGTSGARSPVAPPPASRPPREETAFAAGTSGSAAGGLIVASCRDPAPAVPTFSIATPATSFAPGFGAAGALCRETGSAVPTYSVATPASSFAPGFGAPFPENSTAQMFSLVTPAPSFMPVS